MPLYDYQCPACGQTTEVRHGFDVTHDAPCPNCGGVLKRVFNPAPIVFKGSGFYVTDSRKSRSSAETKKTDAPKTDAPKTDATKTDAPKTDAPTGESPKTPPAPASGKESAA
ncbi:MAG: FmdB family zinc ribbon protein [Candidatus Baltobacteraceae bacterium]